MNTSDYTYDLPPEKVAFYPLPTRDASKLLVYDKGKITHTAFTSLTDHLPENAFLFFNDTRVIPARLHFRKASGATIEIFLLNPIKPSPLLSETMSARHECVWQCTIGNLKKWTSEIVLQKEFGDILLSAALLDRLHGTVKFSWTGADSFAEVIRRAGETPLPPYIKRQAEASDAERYQTIYSHADGAVAAPTAGLHFTPGVFDQLKKKGIGHDYVTLHVSAGTFQPIKTDDPEAHVMHEEQVIVSRENIENLLHADRFVIAVGTTSMRTLESLYWYGARLLQNNQQEFKIAQDDPYGVENPPAPSEALRAVASLMDRQRLDHLAGETSIYIRPGYDFKICRGLITNFHQPGSTLILLVAAFAGNEWRRIYREALQHNYRFLSYGDSSLLIP